MSTHNDLTALADLCGIWHDYYDLSGNLTPTSADTQRAFLRAIGLDVSDDAAIAASLAALRHKIDDRWFPEEIIVDCDAAAPQNFGLGAWWDIRADGSDDIVARGDPADHITLPPLTAGVYTMRAWTDERSEDILVLAAPATLPLVQDLTGHEKLWGLNLSLYGVRSERNTGLGDFEDLAQAAELAGRMGAGFVGINPLHTMGYCDFDAISPYSPSHRGFLNTTYIALDHIPGLRATKRPKAFDALRDAQTVQYADHKAAHHTALEAAYKRFAKATKTAQADFETFKTNSGTDLYDFARFESISEIHGPKWQDWPDGPTAPPEDRIDFHMWLQWVADTQLADAQERGKAAGLALGLYLDLAVGSRRDGAENGCEQAAVAQGVSIGAPPDHLSPEGQNWNLTAFAPRKLRSMAYRPLRRIIAQTIRHAGLIRIDHVLGLNRSYWIPDDGSPGGYIRQPFDSFLAIIKIEAARHGCAVVGEDLGLVPDGFRDTMQGHGFYGYSVLQYEKDDSGAFREAAETPAQVLSCFATHDTPTVKGYETGRDIDWWAKLGWITSDTAASMHDDRMRDVQAFRDTGDFQAQINARLAHSNANLVVV
ncbi:MAG: 4-alpha-glucanotransferase, partial [Octadecabacter sp.]